MIFSNDDQVDEVFSKAAVDDRLITYCGRFSNGGTTAASMAETLCSELFGKRVASGDVLITSFHPYAESAVEVLAFLLQSEGLRGFSVGRTKICFEDEYMQLLATLSWCIACNWRFQFVSFAPLFRADFDGLSVSITFSSDLTQSTSCLEVLESMEFNRVAA